MCDTDIPAANLGQDNKQTHALLETVSTPHVMQSWSGPKDQQNMADNFVSINCNLCAIANTRKDKCEALQEHILKDILPCEFNVIIAQF